MSLARSMHHELRVERRDEIASPFVLGVFSNPGKAGNAMLMLEERGYAPEEIVLRLSKDPQNVIEIQRVFRDPDGRFYAARNEIRVEEKRRTLAGAGAGALCGMLLGSIAGVLAAPAEMGSAVVFGMSIWTRALASLAASGVGAIVGSIVGAGAGARLRDLRIVDGRRCPAIGGVLVGVAARGSIEAEEIEEAFARRGAEVVRTC